MDNKYNRYYSRIRTILGIAPKTIHEKLVAALGRGASAYRTVTNWVELFHEGREDVNNGPQPGRPVSELTDENIELIRQIICDHFEVRKVTSRWVPHQLTAEQKEERVKLCREKSAKFCPGS